MRFALTWLLLSLLCTCVRAPKNLAKTLGFPPATRLLIVHADDLAVTHATNTATASIAALERGSVSSASMMTNRPTVER